MIQTHPTQVEITEQVPSEVEAGADITLTIRVSCPLGCDLRGSHVTIMGPDEVVMASELTGYADKMNATAEVALTVPQELREYAWIILFPRHETENVVHEESTLPISFRTIPHTTSMAVWDVPSPVGIGRSFTVKVGVRCSASCILAGRLIEVLDEEGERVSEGRLGESPWTGTRSLHWTHVNLAAPAVEGVFCRFVKFTGAELPSPHEDSSASFSFRADKLPERRVRVTVIDGKTGIPVEGVEVRLGLYRASTDDDGIASLELPTGSYDLSIRAEGYTAPPMTVEVNEDLTLQVEAVTAPTRAELEAKLMEFEDYPWG